MIVDNLISKNDIKVKGEIIADVNTADRAMYDTKGRDLSDLSIKKENVSGSIEFATSIMPVDAYWGSVCYGDGKFVAVTIMYSNIAAYSTDGITWTQTIMSVRCQWNSVCYGNGKFVAVAYHSVAAYSIDGINWNITTLPANANWLSVCYGNGKFVVVRSGSRNNLAAYSVSKTISEDISYLEDNVNNLLKPINKGKSSIVSSQWNSGSTLSTKNSNWQSICYGNNVFVAVSYDINKDSNKIIYSSDGIKWKPATLPITEAMVAVGYGAGYFVAICNASKTTLYSTDGINWTKGGDLPYAYYHSSVAYCNGYFYVVGYGSSSGSSAYYFYSSNNGETWTSATINSNNQYAKRIFSNNKNILVVINGGTTVVSGALCKDVSSSHDGQFSNVSLPSSEYWYAGAYGNNTYVAIARTSKKAAYTTNANASSGWTASTLPFTGEWVDITFGNGYFVAIAANTDKAAISKDGKTWNTISLPRTGNWSSIAYANGRFVVIDYDNGEVAYLTTHIK